MRQTYPLLLVTSLLACGSSSPPARPSPDAPLRQTGERTLAIDLTTGGLRAARPFFDGQGQLEWTPASTGPQVCDAAEIESRRINWLASPRIDEVRCASANGSSAHVIAVDPMGRALWRRPLGFKTGAYTLDEEVIGASSDGVILSNLTLLDPASGATLRSPRTHPVGADARPVPNDSLSPPALYLPDRKAFVHFSAEVTLLHHEGGLFLLDSQTGDRTLLLPVAATGLGTAWRVEDLARSADGRYLYLATKHGMRGGGGVALSVLDLQSGDEIFSRRFRDDHFCVDPRLALSPRADVGLSFVDQTEGKVVLVTFRAAPPS